MSSKESAVTPVAAAAPVKAASQSSSKRGVAPLAAVQTYDHKKCVERLETAITSHNHIKKVLDAIENLGCQLPADFFVCRTCEFEMTGGFLLPSKGSKTYNPKIILCEDKQIDKRMFQNTVLHELIHAYDICRAKIDWDDCKHYACTEIRASALRSAYILTYVSCFSRNSFFDSKIGTYYMTHESPLSFFEPFHNLYGQFIT